MTKVRLFMEKAGKGTNRKTNHKNNIKCMFSGGLRSAYLTNLFH